MLIALVLLVSPVQEVPETFDDRAWAEFSRRPSRPGEPSTRVQIVWESPGTPGGATGFLLRRTVTRRDGAVTVDWAESRSCPAVRRILVAMRGIEPPRPRPYGFDKRLWVTADGIAYSLRVPSSWHDDMTITSNTDTPLARWVEKSLAALAPCWSPKQPVETL